MGQGGSLTEATTTTQIIWGLLNTPAPKDIKGNLKKFEKRKNPKLNSDTTKKGETRQKGEKKCKRREKQAKL